MRVAKRWDRPATRAHLEQLPPTWRGEIIDGTLYAFPRPRFAHARVEGRVYSDLDGPVDRGRGGPGGRSSRRTGARLGLLAGALLASACAGPQAPPLEPSAEVGEPALGSGGRPTLQRVLLGESVPATVYASRALATAAPDAAITDAVIVQHGVKRNGDAYYAAAAKLLAATPRASEHTILVAPNFFDTKDRATRDDLAGVPLWSDTDWMAGIDSVAGPRVSSFAVLDGLIALLSDPARFPSMKRIVLAGHSGGGQLVERYAVFTAVDRLTGARGAALRFVVANPSSYLYFTPERVLTDAPLAFGAPPGCPDYDRYRYGMDGAPGDRSIEPAAALEERFSRRPITLLLGTADTDPRHPALDRSCAAEAQGAFRLERGQRFWAYLHRDGRKAPGLQAFEVERVGHDQAAMFGSQCAQELLFGAAHPLPGARCHRLLP